MGRSLLIALAMLAFLLLIGGVLFFWVIPVGRPVGIGVPTAMKAATSISETPLTSSTTSSITDLLPIERSVAPFALTDQTGAAFGSDQLFGHAYIMSRISVEKPDESAARVARLTELQKQLRGNSLTRDVRLVSLVTNSSSATPEAIRKLAEAAGAEANRWHFVTGDANRVNEMASQVFGQAGDPLVLVDPQGDVRGTYEATTSDATLSVIMRDLQRVLNERVVILNNDFVPPNQANNLLDPPWLETRRRAQLETVSQFQVFHDFAFHDRVRESGITFRHRVVDDAGRTFVTAHYDHGNGVAIADVNGDELLDVYFVNQVGGSQLWKNAGGGKFENITDSAGVTLSDRIGVSASFADIDNDGDADLFVTSVRGGNALFENDGTGIFHDIAEAAGVKYAGHSSSAEFFDYDRDGWLDLFVVNVGVYTTEKVATVKKDRYTGPDPNDYKYYTSNPDAFAAHLKPERTERSILYHNLKDKRFVDVTEEMKIVDLNWTGDASALDANEDGWPDLYLVNMQGHDQYYENVQGKEFVNKSRELFPATPWGTMGINVFDFNNDGRMDIFLTDMHTDMAKPLNALHEKEKIPKDAFDLKSLGTDGNHVMGNAFFLNQGNGSFKEVSDEVNAENYWPWGLSVGDLNADGHSDAFLTACMNFPFRYAINTVLLNNEGRQFLDSEFILGVEPRRGGRTAIPWFELDVQGADRNHPIAKLLATKNYGSARAVVWGALGSRASAIADLDNDGDLDVITNDFNSEPQVLISDLAEKLPALKFLKVNLRGRESNRDGLGATVRVTAGEKTYTKVYDGQSGYLSQSRFPLYFGLGNHEAIDRVEVTWPNGKTQEVKPVEMNATMIVDEM